MSETVLPLAEWVLEHLPFPILHTDRTRILVRCNPAAAQFLGRAVSELVGQSIDVVLGDSPELARGIDQALRSGNAHAVVLAWRPAYDPEGVRHYRARFEPMRDCDGAIQGVLLVGEDVTDWQVAEAQRLRLARDKALGEALNYINVLIHSTLDFDDIMRRVVIEAAHAVEAGSAVMYVKEGHNDWVARYTYGQLDVLKDRHFSEQDLPDSMRAMRLGQTILINDTHNDPEVGRELVDQHGVQAVLDAPLRMADRPVGDFGLYHHAPGKHFSEAEKKFLDKVGASAGLALQNAERFAKLEQAEQTLRETDARLNAILRNTPALVALLTPDGHYVQVNSRYEGLFGRPSEAFTGRSPSDLFPPETATVIQTRVGQVVETGKVVELEETFPLAAGPRIFATVLSPVFDEAGQVANVVLISTDITERKRMEEHTRHLAEHDTLTALPNRHLLLELLEAELRKAQRSRKKLALLFLDLDRFKAINDTLGHATGDALLKGVAHRLIEQVRRSDVVARLGGDEFTVLLTDLDRSEYIGEVAEGILQTLRHPFFLADQTLYITTSIGVSLYPDDGDSAEGLLRCADVALYDAKDHGSNTYRFFNPGLDRLSRERARIESRLREALNGGGLCLRYQPEFDLRSGQVIGAEALIRWQHPELGLLAPARFIPIAEETDLIVAVDEWVLATACAQAREWLDQGLAPICIGVNLSAKQFERSNLVETVRRHLLNLGLPPEHLELELTESTVMRHVDQTAGRMRELVDMGVNIAIDDFGTGYSSLSYLKWLPIRRLKIDQSFVRDIAIDADDRAIIQAVTALAHSLHKRVIAEGVENDAQRDFLNGIGCDEAQGFLYTEALPPEQFRDLLLH